MGKVHLLTIVACPGVPEPPLEEDEEPVLLPLPLPLLLLDELVVGVTDGAGAATDDEAGAATGGGFGGGWPGFP